MEPILDPEHRELEEGLMKAGRNVGMSPELRSKTLAALGVAAVGTTAATTAQASTWGWLSTKSGVAWIVGAAGTAGVVGAVAWANVPAPSAEEAGRAAVQPSTVQPSTVQPSTVQPSTVQHMVQSDESAEAKEVAPDVAENDEVQANGLREPDQATERRLDEADAPTKAEKGQPPADAGPSLLREELSHIARVESALAKGQPALALSLLGDYRARFALPKLGLEAEVLTIQALSASGSGAAARQRAERFLARHPNSPLTARVKKYAP